jgi:hypothetical protein
MADPIPQDPQQLIQNAASQANPPPVAADALGTTKTVDASSKPLISDIGMDETVAGQLKKLIEDDSPLLEQTRERSRQEAAGRGLQNSTMAVQAGEQAVIATAAPIAAQDAATVSGRRSQNLSTVNQFGAQVQQGEINERLQGIAAQQESARLEQQGQINQRLQTLASDAELVRLRESGTVQERLQTIQQNFQALQADKDRGAALTLEDKRFQNNQALVISEYAQRAGLSQQEASQEIDRLNQAHMNTLDEIAAQSKAATADIGPKIQAQYLSAVNDRMQSASAEVQNIYTTQGLKPDQQTAAVNKANERLRSDLAQLQSYYSQSPLWDDQWGAGELGASPDPLQGPVQIPAQQAQAPAPAQTSTYRYGR